MFQITKERIVMLKKLLSLVYRKSAGIGRDEQCVMVDGNFNSGEEFGTQHERDEILEIEDEIIKTFKKLELHAEYDGHGFGEGTFTLFMYGDSADMIYKEIADILKNTNIGSLEITLRYGPPKSSTITKKILLDTL